MKVQFTKKEMRKRKGCYSQQHLENLSFMAKEGEIFLSDILDSDIPLKDKAWFLRKSCDFTDRELREFAIGCAICVLPIYESKYPENKAPREAIEAAKKCLNNKKDLEELGIKRRAAAAAADAAAAAGDTYAAAGAADAAADVAYAAYAAGDTYAAAGAADAAADVAYAAAADAAAGAADAYGYKTILLDFFKEFTSNVTV